MRGLRVRERPQCVHPLWPCVPVSLAQQAAGVAQSFAPCVWVCGCWDSMCGLVPNP